MEGNLLGKASVQSAAKRLLVVAYTSLSLVQSSGVTMALSRWATYWATNRVTILRLAVINVAITAGSEGVTRSISAYASGRKENSFLVSNGKGSYRIHRQTQINMIMTLFASVFGGPIYFFSRRRWRFGFFVSFGLFNSLLSQGILHWLSIGAIPITAARLAFDFIYNGTVKFCMFEVWRPMIIRHQKKLLKVGSARISQDFATTIIKVLTLNALGFKG